MQLAQTSSQVNKAHVVLEVVKLQIENALCRRLSTCVREDSDFEISVTPAAVRV